jgi:hypothetical protein
MTWRAHVVTDILCDGIAIQLGERFPGANMARAVAPVTFQFVDETPGELVPVALRLPDDLGRALYEALTEHYGGAPITRTQREDYLHERGRVDRLIDAVTHIAAAVPGRTEITDGRT